MNKIDELKKRRDAAIESEKKIILENSPARVKAEFIGCKTCGSRLAKKYIKITGKTCKCPLCGASLFSKTAQARIKSVEDRISKIEKELKAECKLSQKEQQTESSAFTDALNATRDRFDYILEEHKTPDFIEIVGSMGGDVLTFRVYKDGSVFEK